MKKAARKPDTSRPGTCRMVNHSVFTIEVRICGSLNTQAKFANPANDRVPKPSQLENASTTAKISGPIMKTTSPISCGARNPYASRVSLRRLAESARFLPPGDESTTGRASVAVVTA